METVKVKTSALTGAALDWATIAATEDRETRIESEYASNEEGHVTGLKYWCWDRPSSDWSKGGPLIDEYQICLEPEAHNGRIGTEDSDRVMASLYIDGGDQYSSEYCDTALIAVCQVIVLALIGEEVEIPAVLAKAVSNGN